MTKVIRIIPNRSGTIDGHLLTNGKIAEIPEDVLKGLGREKYEFAEDEGDDKPSYKELQDRAKELGLPINKKYDELAALIAEKEAEDEGDDK